MQKIKLEGSVWAEYDKYTKKYEYRLTGSKIDSPYFISQGYIPIKGLTIEIETDIDLNKAGLNALQLKRKAILAENEVRVNQVDQEIQEFLAIEA